MKTSQTVSVTQKKISMEKIKQKKMLQSRDTGFEGIKNMKAWTDETDK